MVRTWTPRCLYYEMFQRARRSRGTDRTGQASVGRLGARTGRHKPRSAMGASRASPQSPWGLSRAILRALAGCLFSLFRGPRAPCRAGMPSASGVDSRVPAGTDTRPRLPASLALWKGTVLKILCFCTLSARCASISKPIARPAWQSLQRRRCAMIQA